MNVRVDSHGRDGISVGRDRQGKYGRAVPYRGAELLSGASIPESDRAISASSHQGPPIRSKRDRENRALLFVFQCMQPSTCCGLPHVDRGVEISGGEVVSVRAERSSVKGRLSIRFRIGFEYHYDLASRRIPEPRHVISVHSHGAEAVRTARIGLAGRHRSTHDRYRTSMRKRLAEEFSIGRVLKLDGVVRTTSEKRSAIGGYR